MITSKVSSETIITRISDLGLAGSGWHALAIEYVGEAIQSLGYYIGFKQVKGLKVDVVNYKAYVPDCVETLEGVKVDGCPLALVYDEQGICNRTKQQAASYNDIVEYNEILDNINCLKVKIEEQGEDCTEVDYLNSMKNELNKAYALVGTFGTLNRHYSFYKGGWYKVANNVIDVSFECGTIEIDGTMFDLDEKGYPYIVGSHKYTEAVFWYVLYKLLLGEYDLQKVTWKEAYAMWDGQDGYRQKALNEGLKMGKDKMERFSRRWLSITRDSREIYKT